MRIVWGVMGCGGGPEFGPEVEERVDVECEEGLGGGDGSERDRRARWVLMIQLMLRQPQIRNLHCRFSAFGGFSRTCQTLP